MPVYKLFAAVAAGLLLLSLVGILVVSVLYQQHGQGDPESQYMYVKDRALCLERVPWPLIVLTV